MPHEETWIKTRCDKCKKPNWICEGNMQDLTIPDKEAIECWSCGNKWWRSEDGPLDFFGDGGITIEEHLNDCAVKGRESP